MSSCPVNPAGEEIADFINREGSIVPALSALQENLLCTDYVSREYSIAYYPLEDILPISLEKYPYYSIPKLFTTLDTSSMEAAGILPVFRQPTLNNQGQGVLIGFIDTGIDYQNPLFRNADGSTRIVGLWDQTLPAAPGSPAPGLSDPTGLTPDIQYGTEFTEQQINQALRTENPLELVPSEDMSGHGTFLAGIAAGGPSPSGDFIGAAPKASIGMVKLKPAKQYLRDFYLIREDANAYQENDIMMGIRYLRLLARRAEMPLVVCISLGSNSGSHEGTTPLGYLLQASSQYIGNITVIAAGNEAGLSHHYFGSIPGGQTYDDVEVRVAQDERGFTAEFWSDVTDLYTIGLISPTGETVSRIPLSLGRDSRISFLLEPAVVTVTYRPSEPGSGRQLIFFRFESPTAGIWRIRIYNSRNVTGRYHIWLPVEGFSSPDTVFLNPNPDTTITNPGNTLFPITVSTYNHYDGGIYIHSSRGFTINNQIKPDIAAPGVNVYGPALTREAVIPRGNSASSAIPMTRRTGSSIAAAHCAGAVANLLAWGMLEGHAPSMSDASVRGYLVRGANRNPGYEYPNREFGYGTLDLYQSFLYLRE